MSIDKIKRSKRKIGSLFIVLLVAFSTFYVAENVLDLNIIGKTEASANWANATYDYRSLITIDKDQVNGALTNFPALIVIYENETIYDNVDDTYIGYAFYDYYDNTTEFAFECEYYYKGGGVITAYFWVNVTSVFSDKNTHLWMYYGGNSVDASDAAGTWDSDYQMVFNMGESGGGVNDSTSNNRDTTVSIDDGSVSYEQTGQVAECLDLTRDVSFIMANGWMQNDLTIEAWLKFDNFAINYITPLQFYNEKRAYWYYNNDDSADNFVFNFQDDGAGWQEVLFDSGSNIGTTNFKHLVSTFEDGTEAKTYINGGLMTTDDSVGSLTSVSNSNGNRLGCYYTGNHWGFEGKMDEVRISKIARSNDWINTCYNCMANKTGAGAFATFGAEELDTDTPSSATLTLPNSKFTTQGQLGNTTYSNESGSTYETGNFSFYYNGTQDIDYLRINVSDIHANITSDNIHLQFTSDNSSWNKGGNWKTGLSGGWSFTLNTTSWITANGCYGTDPFSIVDNSTYISMRVKVEIPAAIGNETYSKLDMTWDSGYYD
jgi:hypothetical protein